MREDTHIFFSGRTTKRGGGVNHLTTKHKKLFFPYKWRKLEGKKLSKSVSGYSKTKKKRKKWHGPLSL